MERIKGHGQSMAIVSTDVPSDYRRTLRPVSTPNAVLIAMTVCMSSAGLGRNVSAAPFQLGDVFAAISSGQVQHYDSSGTLLETLNTGLGGFTTGMAFDATGNLYVTNFSVGNITKFAGPNDPHANLGIFGSGFSGLPESIIFDFAGNVFVGAVNGDNDVRKCDSTGVPLAQFNVPTESRGSDWIDLAGDQNTLFYTSEGSRILRFDLNSNTALADFSSALPGSSAFALRILANGGVLVADTQTIVRLDAMGNLIQSYDATGQNRWFALNLDPDGTSFWSGDSTTSNFFKFDIATGNILLGPINTGTGVSTLFGLALFGEITQAILPPSCNTGGPYAGLQCNDIPIDMPLMGAASCDDGSTPTVMWTSADGVTFSDPTLTNPTATAPGLGSFQICLTVTCTAITPTTCCSLIDVTQPTTDTDGDGTIDCNDLCPLDTAKIDPGICGCGVSDIDTDGDGTADCNDQCPTDPAKIIPGICGCGTSDVDTDGDGTADCNDLCPIDPNKIAPGICDCGVSDIDTDGDGTADCNDLCPADPNKIAPGTCDCGVPDVDADLDGVSDCNDLCPGVDDTVFGDCTGAIPTISEWGVAILALLLLTAGKLYFGRQPCSS